LPDNHARETIEAGRRRKGSQPHGRAEAPRPAGGNLPESQPASGNYPGGRRVVRSSGGRLGGCGLLVFILLLLGYFAVSGIGGLSQVNSSPGQLTVAPPTTSSLPFPADFTPSASGGAEQTWLVMLYQDADDQVLEEDIFIDLNEAERVGSSEYVHIVAQFDRFRSGFNGDGDWTSTRRYYVTHDDDLTRIGSQLISDIGEADMSDGNSLVSFVTWAVSNIPADRYVLILSDHGLGWPGGWSDPDPGVNPPNNIPMVSRLGANLYLMELDEALGTAREQAGIEKFDLIGLDACLMSQMEVLAALQPHARYAVLSEEVEPALGWAYASFLAGLTSDASMATADLSKLIVQSFIRQDLRILDPQARQDYLRAGSFLGGRFDITDENVDELIQNLEYNSTLSAIDLQAYPNLLGRFNLFAYALQDEDQSLVAQVRSYSQSYTNIFGRQVPPAYIDIGHFAALLERNTNEPAVRQAAADFLSALGQAVIAEKHGGGIPGSTGVAIYFPNSTLYSSPITGPQSYTGVADRFAAESLWDDFLAFHYSDRTFQVQDLQRVIPASNSVLRVPGQGTVAVSSLVSSPAVTRPGQVVRLSADITGQNIGYIYLFVGYYDRSANSIYVADTDYLESSDTRQLNGVYYPVWGQNGAFTLAYNWDPIVFAISDGTITAPALFNPMGYGASYEEANYAVEGLYTFYNTGDTLDARLIFQNGELLAVYGFSGEQGAAAPHAITPQAGDRFTLLDKWMDLDEAGGVKEIQYLPGETLTFGNDPFTWQVLDAAAGEYLVGFIIEDMDGNTYPVYTQVIVQ
jgi:hypothetical protein